MQSALYRIAEETSAAGELDEFYKFIHRIVGGLMHAENFYIALYDEKSAMLSFPYFVDEEDETPQRKRLGKGLTEYVLRTGQPLLATPSVFEDLIARGEVEAIGAPSLDWLGVPLIISDKTIGVLVVQTYRENIRYRQTEKDILDVRVAARRGGDRAQAQRRSVAAIGIALSLAGAERGVWNLPLDRRWALPRGESGTDCHAGIPVGRRDACAQHWAGRLPGAAGARTLYSGVSETCGAGKASR